MQTAPVPVLLFTGFLGAGKTTLINRLIQAGHGRRILAMVNDFGAINIDAELIAHHDEAAQVVALTNGCICCSLQTDFLRAAKTALTAEPRPDLIVVEASGVAEPGGVIEMIQDPTLWRVLTLESVICAVDAQDISHSPERLSDPLWKAQLLASDYVFLTKTEGLAPEALDMLHAQLSRLGRPHVFDMDATGLPLDLMLTAAPSDAPRIRPTTAPSALHDARFAHLEWRSPGPVDQAAFKTFLGRAAPSLLRAKGVVSFADMPGRSFLLQLVGARASLTPPEPSNPAAAWSS